jgi:hypothetical protein
MNNSINTQEPLALPIQAYGKAQLCRIYGVSRDTFSKWLKEIESLLPHYNRTTKTLTPAQVKVIFEEIGTPEEMGFERKTGGKKA